MSAYPLVILLALSSAGAAGPPPPEIPLYAGVAPGSEGWDWPERAVRLPNGMPMAQNVVRPVLIHYPAEKAKAVGTAMIVAPGGGFRTLMMSYEGADIAKRLNAMGVDAFVLKYRLAYTGLRLPKPAEVKAEKSPRRERKYPVIGNEGGQTGQDIVALASADGMRAVKLLRDRAGEFGFRPDRVGMIGFSAGGVVTSEAAFGPAESRPNFAAVIYGVSDVREVPANAPPLFIAVAADDPLAVSNSLDLFKAWRKGNGPAELHVFQTGAHGFLKRGGGADHFMDRLEEWLKVNALLARPEK